MINKIRTGIMFAILAASLYALSSPLSKVLLNYMSSTLMAGFLSLGAGLGMGLISIIRNKSKCQNIEEKITKKELPYVIAMVVLDIAAPIFLLLGLSMTSAANASLLNKFEIVATSVIAFAVFKEKISTRLWFGIVFVMLSCTLLSFDGAESFGVSYGSLFILLACISWGIENNCTRVLSSKDPQQIVTIKGIFSGLGALIIAFIVGERLKNVWSVLLVLLLGFVSYGLSIFFYVYAQRYIGATRTSAYYAIAPFIGTLLSLVIFNIMPSYTYFLALALMIAGAYLSSSDEPIFKKVKK